MPTPATDPPPPGDAAPPPAAAASLGPPLPALPTSAPTLTVNGRAHELPGDLEGAMPLLWVLRDVLHLTGTKYACGVAACGACTVLVDGQALRSCVVPLSVVGGRAVTTIEGLGDAPAPHALQQAWVEHQVPQCGYCQSGLLMAARALLDRQPRPTDAAIEAAITGLCRCGSLARVKAAIHDAAGRMQAAPAPVPRPPTAQSGVQSTVSPPAPAKPPDRSAPPE